MLNTLKIHSLGLALMVCLPLITGYAQQKEARPKLVVGVVVDQMRYDYLSRFSEKFTEGGFKKLVDEGFTCKNNYLNYIPTKTAPGHSTIYTGTTPNTHGILGNYWFDLEKKMLVDCVYDAAVDPVGTGDKNESSSPKYLKSRTISDLFKKYGNDQSKTVSVALKARSAVLSGGKNADAAYWFRGKDQGHWITSSYYRKDLPTWVKRFNNEALLEKYMQDWKPLLPIDEYTESAQDDRPQERGFRGKIRPDFPYDLHSLADRNEGYDLLEATPFGNSYTFNFALAALEGERLGTDSITDFLLVSLSSTDVIGHNFGVSSKEIEDTYLRLDLDLAAFITELDSKVGAGEYTLFLTSDHGASENANVLKAQNKNGGYFKEATFKIELKDVVFKKYGTVDIIRNISNNQVFLNTDLITEKGLDQFQIERELKTFIENYENVATVVTRSQLLQQQMTTQIEQFLFNGFDPDRSGDILYALEENVLVYAEKGSDHGSGYEYDTHTPLLFYGFGIHPGTTNKPTLTIDILPTIAEILGITEQVKTKGNPIYPALRPQ